MWSRKDLTKQFRHYRNYRFSSSYCPYAMLLPHSRLTWYPRLSSSRPPDRFSGMTKKPYLQAVLTCRLNFSTIRGRQSRPRAFYGVPYHILLTHLCICLLFIPRQQKSGYKAFYTLYPQTVFFFPFYIDFSIIR